MKHAPTIGALCGGRLAKAKGVRYGHANQRNYDLSRSKHTKHSILNRILAVTCTAVSCKYAYCIRHVIIICCRVVIAHIEHFLTLRELDGSSRATAARRLGGPHVGQRHLLGRVDLPAVPVQDERE